MPMSFQDLILALQRFWAGRGCVLAQPHGVEVGAGTMNPETFFRVLGPEPWSVAYVEPSRRPGDARYGDNPFRLYKHHQFQVILKPSPDDVQEVFLASLRAFGIDPRLHEVRFEEDNWESPTLGAQGVGWQVMLDGMEITQFTYFQRAGGIDLDPISAEITYGIERICMFLNDADSIYDLPWNDRLRYREVRHREEWEFSKYAFEAADVAALVEQFARSESEARRLLQAGLVLPAYDACLRCSHFFNLLEARGAVSVTERTGYILRVRALACGCAGAYARQRQEAGYPLGQAPRAEPRRVAPPRLRSRPRNDFLLEAGCEEIPAAMIPDARDALAAALHEALATRDLAAAGGAQAFSTPRRLAVRLRGVPAGQPDRDQEIIGPPVRVAFDATGAPTQAAAGFARAQGVEVSALRRLRTPKGEYVGLVKRIRGRAAPEVLQEVIPEILRGLSFPKTMRWGSEPMPFVRPLRSLVALWNDQILPVEIAGVLAGRDTSGHRCLGRPKVRIRRASDYERLLKARGVWVDDGARRRRIGAALKRQAAAGGGTLLEHEATLDEVTHLVECPKVIGGRFDAEFLALPREVLLATMRHHQKHFGVVDRKGALLPRFVAVADQLADPKGFIRHGNERVLRARLDDARFFWSEDRKIRLEERAPRLRGILFHEKLGSLERRVERHLRLAPHVASRLPQVDLRSLERALSLAKLDLTTGMVGEFPELQGVVGGLYAREQGEREEIADAIYDQYRPTFVDDETPRAPLGCALSVVDRVDTLAALFGVGEIPTGSRDPFALRRAGQGLVKILLDRTLHLPLDELLERALEGVEAQGVELASPRTERLQAVCEFVRGRVRFLLEQAGRRTDLINAVLAAGTLDPLDVRLRVTALEALQADADFTAISLSSKRIRKILAQTPEDGPLDPPALRESAERTLYESMTQARQRLGVLVGRRQYPEALRTLASLRQPIDRFFDDVMVLDRDPAVRRNRLALLRSLSEMFLALADFSAVAVEGDTVP